MYYTLRGFGWCFSMCFPNFWLDVYILSQSLQSNFPMSILWVRLCCVGYLFCVNVFSHVSQLNIITTVFLTFTMSPPQFNWCFCKLSFRVYTFSHFSHSNLLLSEFSCVVQAHPLPHLCHKRCTFQLCGHFQCASSKYMLCGTFFHRCYSWTRFFGGILCSACWNKVDWWILFHNQHIDLECSWLKVKVTTEEVNNIQNSEYFRLCKKCKRNDKIWPW